MSIIDYIEKYEKKYSKLLFTTPSHSQGEFIAPKSLKFIGKKFFEHDYSELDGFDNLSNPHGIIRHAQQIAAETYRAKSAFYLTNGATSGIVAAMLATLNRGDKVLIARNCHKSVYNGLVLTGAVPIWILPEYNEDWGICESVNLALLDEILSKNGDIKAFIMTNPTYEGIMSDTYRIADICKKYNVLMIVDEAHGALWNFCKSIGTPSVLQGADISVQSLHKTAGAVNPSAILLTGTDRVSPVKIQQALNLITTTSPSYPILANIEATIDYLSSKKGKAHIYNLIKLLNKTIRTLKALPNVEVFAGNNDVTKLLVRIPGMRGTDIADILYSEYDIECELANEKSVLFLTGIGTTKSKLRELEKALTEISEENIRLFGGFSETRPNPSKIAPRVRYTPGLMWNKPSKEIDIKHSVSRVSMELVADYPPGIPIILPGEVIKKEHIEYLSYKKTIRVLM